MSLVKMYEIQCSLCFTKRGSLQLGVYGEGGQGARQRAWQQRASSLLGFFPPMPFLHEPLTLCVTEVENKIGFVFKLWSINAL